jgi:hypothetical protein
MTDPLECDQHTDASSTQNNTKQGEIGAQSRNLITRPGTMDYNAVGNV